MKRRFPFGRSAGSTLPAAAVCRAAVACCEGLERRTLLSTIVWTNRGTGASDTDGFNALFGGNAQQARLVVDRAILDWEEVIVNFNYNGGGNTFNLTVQTADLTSIADGLVTAQNNGKPSSGRVRIDSTGTTHWVDPSAGDDAEFDDNITNAFTGYAVTPPITGVDLYATMVHELGHVLGFSRQAGLNIQNFMTDTGIDDPRDSDPNGGNLIAYNFGGGPIEATFTDADSGHIWEGPGTTATNNAGLPWHSDSLMNPGRAIASNERNLISDWEAIILRDAYGYTIAMPGTINNMLVNPNFTSDTLSVVGQPGAANDLIIVQGTAIPGTLHVTVGTVGGGPQYTEIVPLSQTNSITVNGGDGNDIIRLEYNGGKSTTFNGGNGDDFFDFAFGTRNLGNITGNTALVGGGGTDSVFVYDNNNATAHSYAVNSVRFDRSGWGGFGYAADIEHLTLTTGSAANIVDVPSTFPGQPIVLNSAGGNDVVNLGSASSGLALIRADVQIQNDPAFTILNINDTGSSTPRNAVMDQWAGNFGAIGGLAPAYVTWDNADIAEIHVTTGGGEDAFTVLRCSERLFLKNSGGVDNFTIGNDANGLNAVTGRVDVGPNPGFVFSNLALNDTGNTTGRTTVWAANGNGFILNGVAPQPLRYENVLQLDLRGGTGPDHYALGSVTDDNISINGGGGAAIDSLAVDDRALPASLVFADIGPNFMTRGTGGIFPVSYSVGYAGIESPLYYAPDLPMAVNLYGTSSTIPAGQQMSVFCGAANDAITLYVRDAMGNLTVNGNLGVGGGGGVDSLVVNDSGSTGVNYQFQNLFGPGTTNISGLGSAGFGAASNVENITVNAGSGDDTFDIHSFQSGSALALNGSGGADTVNWTPASRNTVSHVTSISFFQFDGGDGHDYLNFFNDNNASAWNYYRTNAAFSPHRASGGYFLILNDPNVETVYATGGGGNDQIFVQQVRSGTELFVDGAGGSDNFLLTNAGRTQDIRGVVGVYTSGGTDSLSIDDTAGTIGRTFHVGSSSVGAAAGDDLFGPGGSLQFGGINGALTIKCGSGSDTAYVQPNLVTPIFLELNGQSLAEGSGDSAGFALADAQNPQHFPGGTGEGSYFFDNRAPIFYSGAESVAADSVAPTVTGSSFAFNAPQQAITLSFSEAASLVLGALTLTNLTTNEPIAASDMSVSYNASGNVATLTFPGLSHGALPDGDYRLTLPAGAAADLFGNPLTAAHSLDFFFLNGDANHDGRVNLSDFNVLAANFGQSNRTFAQGDFTYDGVVNLSDFNVLASRFGTVLGQSGPNGRPPSPFGSVPVGTRGSSMDDPDRGEDLVG